MINNSYKKEYIIALGFFDGLHTAHKAVLDEAKRQAGDSFVPAVMLFDEHPRKVIKGDAVCSLLQNEKRDRILEGYGLESLFVAFTEIKDMSPEEFVKEILVERFNAKGVVCGFNYRFGKNGEGDSEKLRELCEKYSLSVSVCPRYEIDGEAVSSTSIRKAIEDGELEKANKMLGFNFGFYSEVFSGDKRGRLLGSPTINQFLPDGLAVPKFGVYASKVYFDGKEYVGVTNIGSRPTFDGTNVRSETYIVDFSGDLYGKTVEISICKFIRDEKKFPSAESLKEQIALDVQETVEYFYGRK